jgi:hypothetical protein
MSIQAQPEGERKGSPEGQEQKKIQASIVSLLCLGTQGCADRGRKTILGLFQVS